MPWTVGKNGELGKKMSNSWNELSHLWQAKDLAFFVYAKNSAF
jgi:hypothetical protein